MRRKKSGSFGNKGNVADILYISGVAVALIITIVFGYKIMGSINSAVQDNDAITDEAKAINEVVMDKYEGTMDTFFIMAWIVTYLGALISAWFIDTHPMFFALSLLVMIFVLVALVPVVNTTEELVSSELLLESNWTTHFTMMHFVLQNFFPIIVAQAMLLLIVLYAKTRSV